MEITKISRIELGNGVRHVLSSRDRLRRDDLRREVMTLFGFRREGAMIRECIDESIDALAAQGAVEASGGVVSLRQQQ